VAGKRVRYDRVLALFDVGASRTQPRALTLGAGDLPLWRVELAPSDRPANRTSFLYRERDAAAAGAAGVRQHLPEAVRLSQSIGAGGEVLQVWQAGGRSWTVIVTPGELPPRDRRHG